MNSFFKLKLKFSPWPMYAPERASLAEPKPSSLHTTLAEIRSHRWSTTVPHFPSRRTSTLPSPRRDPDFRRTDSYERRKEIDINHIFPPQSQSTRVSITTIDVWGPLPSQIFRLVVNKYVIFSMVNSNSPNPKYLFITHDKTVHYNCTRF